MPSVERSYSAEHPAAQGHFPDNPVIPGAVLLSDAVQAIASALRVDCTDFRVPTAKFLTFVRPGETITIEYTTTGDSGAAFVCRVRERVAVSGRVLWSEKSRP